MIIETKYDLEDIVFFISDNKIQKGCIQYISYNIDKNVFGNTITKTIFYKINIHQKILSSNFLEKDLFKTKEELIATL